MAKPNTPLLSLEAHGTIGDVLTHQGRGRVKIARKKPKLPYSLTLPQQYQRWLYEDYAYLWRQQASSVQTEYRTAGVRFHRTGFQQWMSVMLSTLPDILGWWRLDEKAGAVAYDSSKYKNNGTIFGASPTPGTINGAFLFDGINDRVDMGNQDEFQLVWNTPFSIEAIISSVSADLENILAKGRNAPPLISWRLLQGAGKLYFSLKNGINRLYIRSIATHNDGNPHHVAVTYTGSGLVSGAILYKDGEVLPYNTLDDDLNQKSIITARPLEIGAMDSIQFFDGIIDDVRLTNRVLDPTEIAMRATRAYP